ncbi:hypothetical protein FB45DRAFT_1148575 [Roridomyces roridus]|uniref:Uncharacterized protein n=1 Tax=Roridomyces roridus TaxID=1738132 RepID=A0AAD7BXM4_9AGAR|nr:hypothetical protein FB45DRAFT_1148575 [Roridomyces roridus]
MSGHYSVASEAGADSRQQGRLGSIPPKEATFAYLRDPAVSTTKGGSIMPNREASPATTPPPSTTPDTPPPIHAPARDVNACSTPISDAGLFLHPHPVRATLHAASISRPRRHLYDSGASVEYYAIDVQQARPTAPPPPAFLVAPAPHLGRLARLLLRTIRRTQDTHVRQIVFTTTAVKSHPTALLMQHRCPRRSRQQPEYHPDLKDESVCVCSASATRRCPLRTYDLRLPPPTFTFTCNGTAPRQGFRLSASKYSRRHHSASPTPDSAWNLSTSAHLPSSPHAPCPNGADNAPGEVAAGQVMFSVICSIG